MFKANFLSREQAKKLATQHGTPLFVYACDKLEEQAKALLKLAPPFGLMARYAMKANPHPEILNVFRKCGLGIDASSGYEAELAISKGFRPQDILLTSQQLPQNLKSLVAQGVEFNATSLHQLQEYGKLFPGTTITVRLNPGLGSGHSVKTNVGGLTSSFGIWHEYIPKVHDLARQYKLKIIRLHTHIGSGADPKVWQEAARISLAFIKDFPDATIINLGGGFKVARLDAEQGSNIEAIGQVVSRELGQLARKEGRELHLELEPGTYLVANAGILLSRVQDIVDTGVQGYKFLKLDTGMNDILRPALYGAQHPLEIFNTSKETEEYVVVGHNCESGDLLTPAPGKPEVLRPRRLRKAKIGDLVVVGGTGAYCASMAAVGYNSFLKTKEIII